MADEKKERIYVGLEVDPALRARIDAAAEREHRSVSGLVRNIVHEYLDAVEPSGGAEAA